MITAEFGPTETFTRHSEGAFLRLKDGSILFGYSRFTGGGGDDDASDLAFMVSRDEGASWSEPRNLLTADMYGVKNIMSVSLMRMRNGDVGCFYIVKASPTSNVIMLSLSKDEGAGFYRHIRCTAENREGIYILNNDRVIRLKTGRLLMPLTFHRSGWKAGAERFYDWKGAALFLISDDDGETWRESTDIVFAPFTGSVSGLQENGAVELGNGIMGWSRTDMGYQYCYMSLNDGENWTPAQPSRFTSPCSPMSIKKDPATGLMMAVWNPIPNYNGRHQYQGCWGRTPLVYALSRDGGNTWSDQVVIEDEPTRSYCYTAIFFTKDGGALLAYCAGDTGEGGGLNRLRINKLRL